MRRDRRGRALGRWTTRRRGVKRLRPQARRIWIEAEDDLRLAPGDERGEPVAEGRV
jgi:hypothetical protein